MGNRGYTLSELMVVIAILGIMAVLGSTTILATTTNQFQVQTAELTSILTKARNMARFKAECVRVSFLTRTQIQVEAFSANGARTCVGPFDTPLRPPNLYELRDIDLSDLQSSDGTSSRIFMFNPTGGLVQDQLLTFRVGHTTGRYANFRIYPALGQIRVK